ncbi:MAG TPA: glycosyltransferase family 4 protein [Thermoanaerobaculia bacterium]|nr:glycosyltransferase family 4 protein [Thermoanaerobaculia bacterium]
MRTAVFSIISPNYRHFVRVLMDSVRRHHPEWERFLLIVGGESQAGSREPDESLTTMSIDALPLPNPRQFYFRYTIFELDTAMKPWMFEHLFGLGYDRVVFLDPDTCVYSPLVELDALPPETFLAVTPHLTGSISGDDHPSERSILLAGTYNLGFLAVWRQPALARFLDWWKEKLEFQCVVDTARGLFADQKWIDLAPGLFPGVAIIRHDGYNVAYWNLEQRAVAGEGSEVTINGQPLRFYHFSGLDPAAPSMLSKHEHGRKLSDIGDARKLVDDYLVLLRAAGFEPSRASPYAFGTFHDGKPVPDAARIAYRNSIELQDAAGADPFAHPELFAEYSGPAPRPALLARAGGVSYQWLSRLRPLVRLFPRHVRKAMRETLLGRRDDSPGPVRHQSTLPAGLNIIGYIGRETGVGESARLCQKSCDAIGLANHLVDVDGDEGTQQAVYGASIFHLNADQAPGVHEQLRSGFEANAYNIGCWHWELPELPDAWIASAAPLDEIWAPSAFIQNAISRKVRIPVVHMPHGIEVSNIEICTPGELGVPAGRFTFLCMFDLANVTARKNPLGAIDAFQRAFSSSSPVALLIKVSQAADHPTEYAAIEECIRGISNMYLTDRMLSRGRVNGLIAACDAVVSLHRSEGFGLTFAEAMFLGKPVVATGWSGNMDFMNGRNSCPVDYELVKLDRAHGPYAAGQQWAEPDVDHAAQFMRRLLDDAAYRARIGERARDTMRTQFSLAGAGLRYQQRLRFLGLL